MNEKLSFDAHELFSLPSNWCWTTLDELMKKIVDGTHHTPTYVEDGVPFLSVKDVRDGKIYFDNCKYISPEEHKELCKRCYPESGDLLITKSGTIGRCAVINTKREFSLFVSVALLKPATDDVNTSFISQAFQAWFQTINVQNDITGTAIKNFHLVDFRKLALPLPPLNEQRRIIAKIEALKARSQRVKEELEAITPLLDQFRQSVLAAAFRGDLTTDWRDKNPDVEPASVLLERIRAGRRRRWEEAELKKMTAQGKTPKDDKWKEKYKEPESVDDSQLPELPDGWCWAKFEIVATIASNLVSPHNYPTSLHIAPDNIEKGSGKLLKYRTIEEDGVTSPKHLFFPGQIVYSKIRPYLSKCILVDFKGLCSADMYPIDSHICSEYLFRYILSNTFLNLIQQEAGSRVVLPKANQEQVYAIPVPVPPLDEQIVIARKVNELLAHKNCLKGTVKNQLVKIEELQESILVKAFRGELVPQDPNDEPASVLLERIRAEREKLDTRKKAKGKSEKKSRKPKPEPVEPKQLSLPGFE